MIEIWKERLQALGVFDTGALMMSLKADAVVADPDYMEITFNQEFKGYGLFVDAGTGRETYIGNPGDIRSRGDAYRREHGLNEPRKKGPKWGGGYTSGRMRTRREWFHRKYFMSYRNILEFLAANLGRQAASQVARAVESNVISSKTLQEIFNTRIRT